MEQIEQKKYEMVLRDRGIPIERVGKYGFAFAGKKVMIGEAHRTERKIGK